MSIPEENLPQLFKDFQEGEISARELYNNFHENFGYNEQQSLLMTVEAFVVCSRYIVKNYGKKYPVLLDLLLDNEAQKDIICLMPRSFKEELEEFFETTISDNEYIERRWYVQNEI